MCETDSASEASESRRGREPAQTSRAGSAHELSTCSIESVIRLTAITSEAMASAGNSVSHQ